MIQPELFFILQFLQMWNDLPFSKEETLAKLKTMFKLISQRCIAVLTQRKIYNRR